MLDTLLLALFPGGAPYFCILLQLEFVVLLSLLSTGNDNVSQSARALFTW